ncbi:MAG: YfhO family protein [Lachnospiraceae bacterium]
MSEWESICALFAYYLASPLNWLILLCPAKYVIEFMTISIVVKIGLCGWSIALSETSLQDAGFWNRIFRHFLCIVRIYGGVQLEYHVARLYRDLPIDYAGA